MSVYVFFFINHILRKKYEKSTPFCQIISTVSSDLACVKQNSTENCDANALEVIEPLESETTHIYAQLACARGYKLFINCDLLYFYIKVINKLIFVYKRKKI